MNKNNQSIGIKGMAKTIFALKREIENQSQNIELLNEATREMKEFLQKKNFEIRTYGQLTQLYKVVEDYQFAITVLPRTKPIQEGVKNTLAFHELDKFDDYFDYEKLSHPALKFDEEERRETIVDSRLNQENPLGLELFAENPVDTFITIQPQKFDWVMFLYIKIGGGDVDVKNLSIFDDLNLQQEWHEKLLTIIEESQVQYNPDLMQLSDPFQQALVKYLQAFGFEAKDAYYLELLAILSEQSNYMSWLNNLHNIAYENKLHS